MARGSPTTARPTPSSRGGGSRYEESVFINCPFDAQYQPLFRALVFAIQDCGFAARCALEVSDSAEVRIARINRIIAGCRLGIHDISRTEVDRDYHLPRFNMPLELGLFLGAREFGGPRQRSKLCLVLDEEPYRYQMFCSDIAGQDIRSHDGRPDVLIFEVRNWLSTALDGTVFLPGPAVMCERYAAFQSELPRICRRFHLQPAELQFVEFRTLAEEWADLNPPS